MSCSENNSTRESQKWGVSNNDQVGDPRCSRKRWLGTGLWVDKGFLTQCCSAGHGVMERPGRWQAWGPSSSSRPRCSGEELKLCRCSWIGNPARCFCLCDTRDMVSLTEPQRSQREMGEAPAVLQGCQRVKEAVLAQRRPLDGWVLGSEATPSSGPSTPLRVRKLVPPS